MLVILKDRTGKRSGYSERVNLHGLVILLSNELEQTKTRLKKYTVSRNKKYYEAHKEKST